MHSYIMVFSKKSLNVLKLKKGLVFFRNEEFLKM